MQPTPLSLPYVSVQVNPVDLGMKGSVEQPNLDVNPRKPQPQMLTARVSGWDQIGRIPK